jgi:glycerol-3-phosphate dehydrogenase
MRERDAISLDVVIFGGGAAGLWMLDELVRAGHETLLLEAHELGSGQTIASQGIIHGGLKYTLTGLFTPSARAISEMPMIWRRCLAGESRPDLSGTRLRSEFCYLWQTSSIKSRLAMIGARAGLRIAPKKLAAGERPAPLANCPGIVARLDEQVIEPGSFISILSQQHSRRIIKIDAINGLEFTCRSPGQVDLVRMINPENGEPLDLWPGAVVLAAGAGNQQLRVLAGFSDQAMQRRPLHMVMIRGDLPALNGHCVDGAATRVTITSTRDFGDRMIWQIGGQIAETGVDLESADLIERARRELMEVLPGLSLQRMQWATYRVDRAEAVTRGGLRPEDAHVSRHGNTITAWPTKLALAPAAAERVMNLVKHTAQERAKPQAAGGRLVEQITLKWPRPVVALPPWETQDKWTIVD